MQQVPHPDIRTILETVNRLTEESYVVGGWVRDRLMGRDDSPDLDVAVSGDGFEVAGIAASQGGSRLAFVPLDSERGTGRIVVRDLADAIVDVSSFKGTNILEDLSNRDFTINAMAIPTGDVLSQEKVSVIDPMGGMGDLTNRLVRACSDRAFLDDPVRILRAFRFSGSLRFTIADETLAMIPHAVHMLACAAGERIRDEFFAVLSFPMAAHALEQMDRFGALRVLFPDMTAMRGCPQNYYHHLDVWEHTLETVATLERIVTCPSDFLGRFGEQAESYLAEEPVTGRPRSGLLKFAALFHDVGKPRAASRDPDGRIRFYGHEQISRHIADEQTSRLRLSTRESRIIGEWVSGHMRPGILLDPKVTRRAVYRLCRDFDQELMGVLMLFLADLSASRGPARPEGQDEAALAGVLNALELHHGLEASGGPIVNGHELMSLFGLEQGVYLGGLLRRLGELQGSGEITGRRQAIAAAGSLILADRKTG